MPVAAISGTAVVALARNAPQKIAGQYCEPSSRSDASARPVGGQTGEMDSPITAYCRPTRATTKYAAASSAALVTQGNAGSRTDLRFMSAAISTTAFRCANRYGAAPSHRAPSEPGGVLPRSPR